jgi:arginine utilization regulatory protein
MVESAFILSENDKKILSLDLFPIFINNEITHSQKSVSIIDCFKNIKKIDLNKELNNYEMELIKNSLINNKGNIAATARQLSIHRSVLYNKMKRLDIDIDKLTECVLT